MHRIIHHPVFITLGMIIILLFLLTFDLYHSATRYLYFSTEIGILLFAMLIYFPALNGIKWNDPPEKEDMTPQPEWKTFAKRLFTWFFILALFLALIWIVQGFLNQENIGVWLKKGFWYIYYIGIFSVSLLLIKRHLQYVHPMAMITTIIIMVYFLTTYEMLLFYQNTGWTYNNTVIGMLLGVPIDNILFIYPVAPALTMVFYSILTRHYNDLKAFWLLNLILAPCSIIVELIGIYPLNLWEINNEKSICPMGQTNLEEFLYYFLFQYFSIILYVFFTKQFKEKTTTTIR